MVGKTLGYELLPVNGVRVKIGWDRLPPLSKPEDFDQSLVYFWLSASSLDAGQEFEVYQALPVLKIHFSNNPVR